MRLRQNSSTAVVVRKSWANLQAIRSFLRPCATGGIPASKNGGQGLSGNDAHETRAVIEDNSTRTTDDSQTIFARVLDDRDSRGLWIKLSTMEHEQDPSVELQALMIPWPEVLAVVVGHDFGAAFEGKETSRIQLEKDDSNRTHTNIAH